MKTKVCFDDILISTRTLTRWSEMMTRKATELVEVCPNLEESELPYEQMELVDGSLFVFVNMPVFGRVEMEVPAGEWNYRDSVRN